jgi:hypothetical protein
VPFEIIKSELENSIGIFSYPELGISKDVRLINAEKYLDNL